MKNIAFEKIFYAYTDGPAFWIGSLLIITTIVFAIKWLFKQGLVSRTKNWWHRSDGSAARKPVPRHA